MFIDKVKIHIKAGNGGNGIVSFYTEKYVAKGGPDGGDGGKGGSIIFKADDRKTSLIDFRGGQRFKAEDGFRGEHKYRHGKGGKDLVIKVPRGTIVRDFESDGVLADLFDDGAEVIALQGGFGGKGNARFKSSRRRTPSFAQSGAKTEEKCVVLELKTIAEIGLIGFPNVGKSTLLSVISSAQPKIANYHFTTISPNLGVVQYYDNSFTVADIPGLIEGAADGLGLGHAFLRHIERTRVLVHVIDISGSENRDPVEDYFIINKELKKYGEEVANAPQIVVLNKCDLLQDDKPVKNFIKKTKTQPLQIIGAIGEGTDKLVAAMFSKLKELPPLAPLEYEPFEYAPKSRTGFEIIKTDENEFEIFGGLIDELARNVTLDSLDSLRYFQKKLKEEGVFKQLKKEGMVEGDTVRIMDIEFEYVE
ncbi:MAG: GTPase ObgE [Firmicutes bacterium]|nr:GTPase ObgE [Bacillota bacterium]